MTLAGLRRRCIGCSIVLLALMAALPCAAVIDAEQILRGIAAAAGAEVRFTETRTSRLLKTPLVSSGVLRYGPAGRLQKDTLQPFRETVVIDGLQVTIERDGAQTVVPLVAGSTPAILVQALRAVLGGQAQELQAHYRIAADGSPDNWSLELQPRSEDSPVRLRLTGSGADVRDIEVRGSGGDRVVTTLSR